MLSWPTSRGFLLLCGGDDRSDHAFRAEIGQDTLSHVHANRIRLEQSTTVVAQYYRARASFADHPQPAGILLHWVCRETIDKLDLTNNRLQLAPG